MTHRRPLRCARPTGFAALRGRREPNTDINQRSSTHTTNQHGVEPPQASTPGPLQTATPRRSPTNSSESVCAPVRA